MLWCCCSQTATANTSCCSDSTGASAEDTLDCSASSVLMLFLSYCFNSVLHVITKAGWIVHHKSTPHQKCHFSKQYITLINSCITIHMYKNEEECLDAENLYITYSLVDNVRKPHKILSFQTFSTSLEILLWLDAPSMFSETAHSAASTISWIWWWTICTLNSHFAEFCIHHFVLSI